MSGIHLRQQQKASCIEVLDNVVTLANAVMLCVRALVFFLDAYLFVIIVLKLIMQLTFSKICKAEDLGHMVFPVHSSHWSDRIFMQTTSKGNFEGGMGRRGKWEGRDSLNILEAFSVNLKVEERSALGSFG